MSIVEYLLSTVSIGEWIAWGCLFVVIFTMFYFPEMFYSKRSSMSYGTDWISSFLWCNTIPHVFLTSDFQELPLSVMELDVALHAIEAGDLCIKRADVDQVNIHRKRSGENQNGTVIRIRVDMKKGIIKVDGNEVSLPAYQVRAVLNMFKDFPMPNTNKTKKQDSLFS